MAARRDYEAHLDEWMESLGDEDYIAPIEAGKFNAMMREQHPRLLAVWLDERADTITSQFIGSRIRSERAKAQGRVGARSFAEWAERFRSGEEVSILEVRFVIDTDNTRRELRNMTRADLAYVIQKYDQSAAQAQYEAAYLRAVQRRLRNNTVTVGEVLTDEDIARLRIRGQ